MRVLAGGDTGLVKVVEDCKVVRSYGQQGRGMGVVGIARVDGTVYTTTAKGHVHKIGLEEHTVESNVLNLSGVVNVVANMSTLLIGTETGEMMGVNQDTLERDYSWNCSVKQGGTVQSVALDSINRDTVAVGGSKVNLAVYDLEGKNKYTARNPPANHLDMNQTSCIRTLSFSQDNASILITGTSKNQVHLYDIREQSRRPVLSGDIGDHAITAVCTGIDSTHIYAGDSQGRVVEVDRRGLRVTGAFKGGRGAVRQVLATEEYLFTCGLDRYLRMYKLSESRKLVGNVFMKQKVFCMDVIAAPVPEVPHDESDDIWAEVTRLETEHREKRHKPDSVEQV